MSFVHHAPQFWLEQHVILYNITGAWQLKVQAILIRIPIKTKVKKGNLGSQPWLTGKHFLLSLLFLQFF